MTTCDWAGCSGHLGKFDDCLTEALYCLALDDADWVGSSDFGVSAAFLVVTADDVAPPVPAGFYAVSEDSNGFVARWTYASESDMDDERERLATAYAEWEGSE